MSMTNIVFLEVEPADRPQVEAAFPEATILEGPLQDHLADCKDAEVISCMIYSKCTAENLAKLPNLKLLCTRTVGYDHIDLTYCQQNNITTTNVPDYGSHVIAEHVFALLLSTVRHILEGDKRVESGEFDYAGLRGIALRGKTIGIVGTGKIGRRVAQIAHGFGMKILALDRCRVTELSDLLGVRYVAEDEFFASCDIVSLHLPATEETKHMINADRLQQMKDGVIIINTARGALIDSAALVQALDSGKVQYALLDVLEHEKNFEDNKELIEHDGVVTTPHIAFYADDSMSNMFSDCFQSISQWLAGTEPEHVIRPPQIICDLPGVQK